MPNKRKKRTTKSAAKKKHSNRQQRCEGCKEDDVKVKPVTVSVGGRRFARWQLCRMCTAMTVREINPWVKK